MESRRHNSLIFKPGTPVLVAIEAKRILPPQTAPRGYAKVEASLELSHGENNAELITRAAIVFFGETEESPPRRVFETRCTYECPVSLAEAPTEERLQEDKFVRAICGPVYVLASSLAQDMAWKMGYRGVEAPLFLPRNAREKTLEKTTGNTTRNEVKPATKAARPPSAGKTTRPKRATRKTAG